MTNTIYYFVVVNETLNNTLLFYFKYIDKLHF